MNAGGGPISARRWHRTIGGTDEGSQCEVLTLGQAWAPGPSHAAFADSPCGHTAALLGGLPTLPLGRGGEGVRPEHALESAGFTQGLS